jgi:CheY-like chemotaxis protein
LHRTVLGPDQKANRSRGKMIDKRVKLLVSTIVRAVKQGVPVGIFAISDFSEVPERMQPKDEQPGKQGLDAEREPVRVLVVDDESVIADSVAKILNRSGYRAVSRYSGAEAIESIQEACPDIIVSDVVMPDLNGIQLAKMVRAMCPRARIVLFSGNVETASLLDDATMEGYFFEILPKPLHPLQLLKALKA